MQVLESAFGSSGTATLATAASSIGADRGLVAGSKRYIGSSADPQPTVPAGWTLIGPALVDNSGGTFKTGVWLFGKRGNGAVNSVTITGPNAALTNQVYLWLVDDVGDDQFWEPWTNTDAAGTISTPSLPLGPKAATRAGGLALAMGATGGTAGGSGFAWSDGFTRQAGGSSSSGITWATKALPAVNDVANPTLSWTTAGVGRAAMVVLRPAAPAGDATLTASTSVAEPGQQVTLTLGGGTTTELVQTAGTPVALTGSGTTRTFTAPGGLTSQDLTFRHTVQGDATPATVTVRSLRDVYRVKRADGTMAPARLRVV